MRPQMAMAMILALAVRGVGPEPAPVKGEPVRAKPRQGRNKVCKCGSGKKFKQCCRPS